MMNEQAAVKRQRWNWNTWLAAAQERVTDADALELARALPSYARRIRTRAFMCYELMYNGNAPLKHWESRRIMPACWTLKSAGLLDSCPGFGALFAPILPQERTAHQD